MATKKTHHVVKNPSGGWSVKKRRCDESIWHLQNTKMSCFFCE